MRRILSLSVSLMVTLVILPGCGETPANPAPRIVADAVSVQPPLVTSSPASSNDQEPAGTAQFSSEPVDPKLDPDAIALANPADVPRRDGEKGKELVGTDWPIFLGPHGTGVSDETGLLEKWPELGPTVLWDKRIGTGYSSPSIRGNRLVIH